MPLRKLTAAIAATTLTLSLCGPVAAAQDDAAPGTILFLGDSLTAGFGIDPELAFPALIQERLRERGWPWRVTNGGVSGETSAGGLRRVDWLLRQPVDVLSPALTAIGCTELSSPKQPSKPPK